MTKPTAGGVGQDVAHGIHVRGGLPGHQLQQPPSPIARGVGVAGGGQDGDVGPDALSELGLDRRWQEKGGNARLPSTNSASTRGPHAQMFWKRGQAPILGHKVRFLADGGKAIITAVETVGACEAARASGSTSVRRTFFGSSSSWVSKAASPSLAARSPASARWRWSGLMPMTLFVASTLVSVVLAAASHSLRRAQARFGTRQLGRRRSPHSRRGFGLKFWPPYLK
jgi:hypothetical protein